MTISPLFSTLDLALVEIEKLGKLRAPVEACGILLDAPWQKADGTLSWVKELPNRSLQAGRYEIDVKDLQQVLEGLEDVEDIAVWHTHPSGYIGPSKGDMENRPNPEIKMLVVSLTEAGPIPTWF